MRIVGIACLALGLAYGGYLAMLYLGQDGMVFPGRRADQERVREIRRYYPRLETMDVRAADGTMLRGFYLPRTRSAQPAPAVLYFTGNAEEQTGFFLWGPSELREYTIAGIDYRGYGASEGSPSETAVKADALVVYDALAARLGPDTPIVVMGRSLGSGVAAHVAANRPVAGVILVTPYESLVDVGQDAHPLVPVRLLMKHPFDVAPDAVRVTAPALMLVAGADQLVPPRHAARLAALWPGPKEVHTLGGASHGSIVDSPEYWRLIREFLAARFP